MLFLDVMTMVKRTPVEKIFCEKLYYVKSSRQVLFFRKVVLTIFGKFQGKYSMWGPSFVKLKADCLEKPFCTKMAPPRVFSSSLFKPFQS